MTNSSGIGSTSLKSDARLDNTEIKSSLMDYQVVQRFHLSQDDDINSLRGSLLWSPSECLDGCQKPWSDIAPGAGFPFVVPADFEHEVLLCALKDDVLLTVVCINPDSREGYLRAIRT